MENEGDQQLVERLNSIGSGSEAEVFIEIRNFFPGIGWDVYTTQPLACANREDHNPSKNCGHRNFLRHAIIKKIEDFFVQQGQYRTAHIPRPLGSYNEGYFYEFVMGSEGFVWQIFDGERNTPIKLEEWGSFVGAFSGAGIELGLDVADVEDGRVSQNIILSYSSKLDYSDPKMSPLWARIDFGSRSVQMKYDKLEEFLSKNKEKLMTNLSSQRYEFLDLALQYLEKGPGKMDRRDIGKLEVLTGNFRISTLSHLNKRGFSADFSKKCGVYVTEQRIDEEK